MSNAKTKKKRQIREGSFGLYAGFGMMGLLILAGLIVPLISKYDPNQPGLVPMSPPDGKTFFGTDLLGRDVFTRVFDAVFIDLGTALVGVSIPLIVGTIIGTLLGISKNKKINTLVGSIIDGINAFPFLNFRDCSHRIYWSRCQKHYLGTFISELGKVRAYRKNASRCCESTRLRRGCKNSWFFKSQNSF